MYVFGVVGIVSNVAITLDHSRAKEILFDEAALSRTDSPSALVSEWASRVKRLGELCPHRKSATVIAALGTAILAKATNLQVDVYSLLDRGESPTSYSARTLADNVWARHRAELTIDLGANGTNPLNNTPFIGKTRIDEITGVRNQEGWAAFLACIKAVEALASESDARAALRGFLIARTKDLIPPVAIDPTAGDALLESELLATISEFVAEQSEGGRRAQAAAAAMLDAAFGADRITVGVINDPDRRTPLDISVRNEVGGLEIAFEVKDKPIDDHHIRASIEKTVQDHAFHNLAFVAVSNSQKVHSFDGTISWAARHGVKLSVFFDWKSLYLACKCFARPDGKVFEGKVFRQLLERASQLEVSESALESLRNAIAVQNSQPPT